MLVGGGGCIDGGPIMGEGAMPALVGGGAVTSRGGGTQVVTEAESPSQGRVAGNAAAAAPSTLAGDPLPVQLFRADTTAPPPTAADGDDDEGTGEEPNATECGRKGVGCCCNACSSSVGGRHVSAASSCSPLGAVITRGRVAASKPESGASPTDECTTTALLTPPPADSPSLS